MTATGSRATTKIPRVVTRRRNIDTPPNELSDGPTRHAPCRRDWRNSTADWVNGSADRRGGGAGAVAPTGVATPRSHADLRLRTYAPTLGARTKPTARGGGIMPKHGAIGRPHQI